jgi:hypothetical protein
MVKSIENFLSNEDRQLITSYIKEMRKPSYDDEGIIDPPSKEPLRILLGNKRREWETALKVFPPGEGQTKTYWKLVMKGTRGCVIKDFLDIFEEMLGLTELTSEHSSMLINLENGLSVYKSLIFTCPCPAEG